MIWRHVFPILLLLRSTLEIRLINKRLYISSVQLSSIPLFFNEIACSALISTIRETNYRNKIFENPYIHQSFTYSLNPLKSIDSTIWNLFVATKDVNGALTAFIRDGRFKLSIASLKFLDYYYFWAERMGRGCEGVSSSGMER